MRALVRTVCVAGLVLGLISSPALAQAPDRLERQKLRQEIRKLELENRSKEGFSGFVATYGALLTGVAALGTVILALGNLARQRSLDRKQREAEAAQRLDERFSATLTDLGAQSVALQAGAAVSLLSFLRPEQREYHRQIRLVALANVKVREPGAVANLLVRVLGDALRSGEPITPDEIDFAGMELSGIDLTGLDLRQAVLRKANLRDARVGNADLRGVRAYRVCLDGANVGGPTANLQDADLEKANAVKAGFRGARLNGVRFRGAILTGARFESAKLQSAHFEGAQLEGAQFQGADINDAFFQGAVLDEDALSTLQRATNKWQAHFSPEIEKRLRELERQESPGEGAPKAGEDAAAGKGKATQP